MKTAVSNLAWGGGLDAAVVDALHAAGVDGVEIAPTAVWASAPVVGRDVVLGEAAAWRSRGLPVVGVQSLLFGQPQLRLFDPATHSGLRAHLTGMLELAGALGARTAVFGSPRNRLRGSLAVDLADEQAAEFFISLEPVLAREGVTLTLEPNAPAYGADYLTTYEECCKLADLIGSPWIAPQVDTGCLRMVGVDPADAVRHRTPAHVHASAPHLSTPPADIDHGAVASALREVRYGGWVTLEMRRDDSDPVATLRTAAAWLVDVYGGTHEPPP